MAEFKYLLETSTCIELLRGNERVRQRCVEHN
jgi:predicted nucleic acid-binding protein